MKTVVLSIPDSTCGETIPTKLYWFVIGQCYDNEQGIKLAKQIQAIWAFRSEAWGPSIGTQETDWMVTVQGPDEAIEELQRCAAR